MNNEFKILQRKESGGYYIIYNKQRITMHYIPKIIKKVTMDIFNIFHNNNGKIINSIKGRLIEFPTKEDAQNAADFLCAKIVEEKLFE